MNENTKTAIFALTAGAVVALAVFAWPTAELGAVGADDGGLLFPKFRDPKTANSLEIIEYDEATSELKPLQVERVAGVWSIPTKQNYPADASRQLAEATAALVDLKKLGMVTDDASQHETYGVIEPDPKKLSSGTTGVGTRVVLKDKDGTSLLHLVIGKEVKDRPELHYVRVTGQSRVYKSKVKLSALSTSFDDWIEEDLLKLNTFDIKSVQLNDYAINELQVPATLSHNGVIDVNYENSKWSVNQLRILRGDKFQDIELGDDTELDSKKLDDMKNALDELKIEDVRRKPAGLSRDLRADKELIDNREALENLIVHGFRIGRNLMDPDRLEVFSNDGEIRCQMKDGVEYVLRFGRIADTASESDAKEPKDEEGDELDEIEDDSGGANRYILVTAAFDKKLIPLPELPPLPEDQAATNEEKSKDGEAVKDAAKNGEEPTKKYPGISADKDQKGKEASDKAKQDKAKQERDRILKDRERLQKDYDDKVKRGQDRAKELGDRFADWYYVISDKTYQKIHLGPNDVVKKKEPKKDEKGADAGDNKDAGASDIDDKNLTLDPLKELPPDEGESDDEDPAE